MNNPVIQSFMDGATYFFGVGENPIEKRYQYLVNKRKAKYQGLSGFEIDAQKLRGDWERVGMYINYAIGQYEHETADTNE